MSNRTSHLPPLTGPAHVVRELRYHEASRQLFAVIFVIIVAIVGTPANPALFYAGAALALLGMLIRLWASGHVKKNKILATDGPYAWVRHPLYVGNILLLVGFSLACGLWWSAPLFVALIAFYYPTAISYEDYKLHRIFGEQWENWRRTTRALIPTLPERKGGLGNWSLRQSLVGNGEPLIVALVIYCLYHLHTQL